MLAQKVASRNRNRNSSSPSVSAATNRCKTATSEEATLGTSAEFVGEILDQLKDCLH